MTQNPYGQQPYPGGADGGPSPYGGPAVKTKPSSVGMAVNLIYAQVALSVISALVGFTLVGSLVDDQIAANPALGVNDADALRASVMIGLVIGLIIGVAVNVLLAVFIGKGANWARIVWTVFAVISLAFGLIGIAGQPLVLLLTTLVGIALTIATLVFLFTSASNAYFKS